MTPGAARFPAVGAEVRPKGTTITWAGEILNLAELRRDLGLDSATSEAQTLLEGWHLWKQELFPRLEGTFTLTVDEGDELFLYNDPSGLMSLYVAPSKGEGVSYSGQLAALQASTAGLRATDRRSIHEYLRFLEVAPPHTFLSGVSAVEAGHAMRWSVGGGLVEVPIPPSTESAVPQDFSEAVNGLGLRLERSVASCLSGARQPAAFLSGGVDSALLCAMAAPQRPDLTAITVGFEGQTFDETPVAARIAHHLRLRHEVLRFTRDQYLYAFDRLGKEADQPMADPAAMATLLAFEHCVRRHDMVLDGTGADEAVGLMPPRHVRVAVEHASRLPGGLRRKASQFLRTVPWLNRYAPILDFDHPADTMTRWHGFSRAEIQSLCGEPVSLEHTQFMRTFGSHPRRAHFERQSALLNAMTSDRLNQAMAISGARVRFPFWDTDSVRYIRQLRTDFRYVPGQPKRILRTLLSRFVPANIWDLPKHSFNFPLHEFLAKDNFALVREQLAPARWRRYGILNVEKVQWYGQQYMAGDARVLFRVWALVVLGAWLEQHKDPVSLCP